MERFEMGCSMYEFSKELVIRGVLKENPYISETRLRQQIFLKFYGNDFEPEQRDKILKWIEQKDPELRPETVIK